jgi:hypothetical protein
MALTFNDLVDRARAIAPEISQALAVSFANERTGRLVAESEYRTRIGAMTATTTAGGNAVDIDTDVVDIRRAWIGTDRYEVDSYAYIKDLEAGREDLNTSDGRTGVVAPYWSSTGTPQLYFYPAFSNTGDSITVEEALHPSDSVYGGTDAMAANVPKHIRPGLLDGILSDAYEYTGRWDEAQNHEQRYEATIDKLRRLKNTKVGSGPAAIKLLTVRR